MTGDSRSGADAPGVAIDFYWRPGCPFCASLERSLARRSLPYVKRNIWEDPAHAAFVRSVAAGDETVPTLRIGTTTLVNPSARDVVAVAAYEFPGLVANPPVSTGLLRKVLRRLRIGG